MPGKCFTWFVVFSYVLSIAAPLNAQVFQRTQATESPTPSQSQTPSEGTQPPPAGGSPERRLLPPPSAPSGGMVSLNFNRADLVEIIHILAQHLRLTYTIDPEVKGTVTINSAEPLRTEDLLPIFHQVLRMNGAVAVRTGNIYRIMPIKDGKGLARPVGSAKEDSFAVQIVPVRFFAVAEMKKLLTPFVAPGGEIIENPRGNFLIIVDLPSNIQRLTEIADLIDVQVFAGTRMEIYQPKVGSAEELAAEMTKIMQSFAASAPQTDNFTAQFVALPRINQLLVISHSEAAWTYARRWLERIDVVSEGPGRRIFVYPVENGKATELADVLSKALGIPSVAAGGQARTLENLHRSTTGTGSPFGGGRSGSSGFGSSSSGFGGSTSGFGMQQPLGGYAAVQVPGAPGQPVAPGAPAIPGAPGLAPVPGAPRVPAPGTPGAKPEEQVRVVADPATNSLIIYGTAQEFQNIKNILKELDAVPRQVLMDVTVIEVTLTDDLRFGVDYEILRKPGNPVTILGRSFNSRGGLLGGSLPDIAAAGTFQSFPSGLSGIVGTGNAVRAFINAMMNDSRFKILSSPSILATDNRPARIQVGSEEPIATGSTTVQVGTPASTTTIEYRNTGRIVTLIPQVNSQGLVNLQILAEVSSARQDGVVVGQDTFPVFDIRQAETTAVVQDGETLVIGGIIADNKNRSRTGIPYLMDIPVLGRFFGTTTTNSDRTELIMLITPNVIRNRAESRFVTEEFKSRLGTVRNELERMRKDREQDLERMKRYQQEQEKDKPAPPVPFTEPPGEAPRPAPSSGPVSALPPAGPVHKINVVSGGLPTVPVRQEAQPPPNPVPSSLVMSRLEPAPTLTANTAREKGSEVLTQRLPLSPPATVKRAVPTEPAQVASLPPAAANNELPSEKVAVKVPREQARPTRLWAVQVAAFARNQDAETLAGKLKDKGYDAYVMVAEVNSKIWHRVRIGQTAELPKALELRKRLQANENFAQAYVAGR
jgi:general secretion pathway protein D